MRIYRNLTFKLPNYSVYTPEFFPDERPKVRNLNKWLCDSRWNCTDASEGPHLTAMYRFLYEQLLKDESYLSQSPRPDGATSGLLAAATA